MGAVASVEVVARDRRTGSVVLLSSVGVPNDERIRLLATLQIQLSNDEPNPLVIPGEVEIVADRDPVETEGLQEQLGLERREALSGRYEVYEGVLGADAETEGADVFAISDPVEWVLIGAGLGVCLALRATDLWLAKQVLDGYKRQGFVANLKLKTSWRSAVTCSFEIDLQVVDPKTGKVVKKQTIRVGKKKKK